MALNLIEVQKNHLIIMVAKLKVFTAFSKKADWVSSEPHAVRINRGKDLQTRKRTTQQPTGTASKMKAVSCWEVFCHFLRSRRSCTTVGRERPLNRLHWGEV